MDRCTITPGFRTPLPRPLVTAVEASLSGALPTPGRLSSGSTGRGLSSWTLIKSMWRESGQALTLSAWTISPRIAGELVQLAKELPFDSLVLDRSQGSRNGALAILAPLSPRLLSCHAKVAIASPWTWWGSANLSESRGIECWCCVNDVALAAEWRVEVAGWR
jgi:hypothetical protein